MLQFHFKINDDIVKNYILFLVQVYLTTFLFDFFILI